MGCPALNSNTDGTPHKLTKPCGLSHIERKYRWDVPQAHKKLYGMSHLQHTHLDGISNHFKKPYKQKQVRNREHYEHYEVSTPEKLHFSSFSGVFCDIFCKVVVGLGDL
jgi:hypothetical protein